MADMAAPRDILMQAYHAALSAVAGDRVVAANLRAEPPPAGDAYVIAIGKAAERMTAGALAALGSHLVRALVITKHGYSGAACRERRVVCREAGHPLPDAATLEAGRHLLTFIAETPHEAELIFLISGGASSLVEVLPEGVGLQALSRTNRWLLASGLDIAAVNRVRKGISCIKAGRLVRHLEGRRSRNLMLSDVPGDDPRVIGSGLLVPHSSEALALDSVLPDWLEALRGWVPSAPGPEDPGFMHVRSAVIAGNADARNAAADAARAAGLPVFATDPVFEGDALALGRRFAQAVAEGAPGLYVWGGESTVVLPDAPGRGGRSQALALAAAEVISGRDDVALLAAGTDGSDGPTEDAGALVDGGTLERGSQEGLDPDECLRRADAGAFLDASGDLIQTGPTGTNVMDLVLGLKTE